MRRSAPPPAVEHAPATANPAAGLPELRDFIRSRRAALFGFMEQGAALDLNDDVLTIVPRKDIYIRYLSDNRGVIAELASELYGRRIRAEISEVGAAPTASAASAPTDGAEPAKAAPASAENSPDTSSDSSSDASPETSSGANRGDETGTARTDDPATPAAAVATDGMSPAELKQSVYGDPVVKRVFDEFQARLVEVRAHPSAPPRAGDPGPHKL